MSSRISGRLSSNALDDEGRPAALDGLVVALYWTDSLYGMKLGEGTTDATGFYSFPYRKDGREGRDFRAEDFRLLQMTVTSPVGREIARFEPVRDIDAEIFNHRGITLDESDARGWLVTMGTGQHKAGANTLPGWGLSQGNRIAWLMDADAFTRAAELFATARDSILMSQLFFPVPEFFTDDGTQEGVKLLFGFEGGPPDPAKLPRKLDPKDLRPERLLVAAAERRVPVRVLLHAFEVPLFVKILLGALVFPFGGTATVREVVGNLLDDDLTDADEGQRYFARAKQERVKVRPFEQRVASAGVMHAKLVVADRGHALSIGSPFGQSYVTHPRHPIDEPMRGASTGLPKHDAGFALTGPGAVDLFRTLQRLWDTATPDDPVPDVEPPQFPPVRAPELTELSDGVASVQIVRTLSVDRFPGFEAGEKGILEAYLRAIHEAEQFVYLETQYFTDDPVGDALAKAMQRKPNLQVILVVNITPDVPFYPFKQRRLITRIREAIKQPPGDASRFGVFTRWTHEVVPKPRLLPVYIHAKAGIADNRWATVGSANLDGLSLDSCMLSDVLNRIFGFFAGRDVFPEQRAIEVNAAVFDGIAGQPDGGSVDVLRRKLWAEHLGYFKPDGSLDLQARELANIHVDGWLGLWNQRAAALLKHLREQPSKPSDGMGRVLPWPDEDETFKTPRTHVKALKIDPFLVLPLKSTRAFDFVEGDWKKGSKEEVDVG